MNDQLISINYKLHPCYNLHCLYGRVLKWGMVCNQCISEAVSRQHLGYGFVDPKNPK